MNYMKRELEEYLLYIFTKFPVVTVTGPRQSGKSTLVRRVFSDKTYVSCEDPDVQLFAKQDPRGFLETHKSAVIDEAQKVPEIFSYIQTFVDRTDEPGQFVLTGSSDFLLFEKITQSLTGRTAVLNLLPFSIRETQQHPEHYEDYLFSGFYPRIYKMNIPPGDFYPGLILPYSSSILLIETPEEILSDKIRAIYERTYLKGRDIYDIWWLNQQRKIAPEWMKVQSKLNMYEAPFVPAREADYFQKIEAMPKVIEALESDLPRFLPGNVLSIYEEDHFKAFFDTLKAVTSTLMEQGMREYFDVYERKNIDHRTPEDTPPALPQAGCRKSDAPCGDVFVAGCLNRTDSPFESR